MHLNDPQSIARRALEIATSDTSEVTRDSRAGFGNHERRIIVGISEAFCELFREMFNEGVAGEASDERTPEEILSDREADLEERERSLSQRQDALGLAPDLSSKELVDMETPAPRGNGDAEAKAAKEQEERQASLDKAAAAADPELAARSGREPGESPLSSPKESKLQGQVEDLRARLEIAERQLAENAPNIITHPADPNLKGTDETKPGEELEQGPGPHGEAAGQEKQVSPNDIAHTPTPADNVGAGAQLSEHPDAETTTEANRDKVSADTPKLTSHEGDVDRPDAPLTEANDGEPPSDQPADPAGNPANAAAEGTVGQPQPDDLDSEGIAGLKYAELRAYAEARNIETTAEGKMLSAADLRKAIDKDAKKREKASQG
jgi:hypothetical protein